MELNAKMKLTSTELVVVLAKSGLSPTEGLATLAKTLVILAKTQGLTDDDIRGNVDATLRIMHTEKH